MAKYPIECPHCHGLSLLSVKNGQIEVTPDQAPPAPEVKEKKPNVISWLKDWDPDDDSGSEPVTVDHGDDDDE